MDTINDAARLRECYGQTSDLAARKTLDYVDKHARAFIGLCPLMIMATSDSSGADCSPRGDAPGFVQVADDKTLVIPDRRGNNRLDSLQNVAANPEIGLLFLVPGINETLRINGRAEIVIDAALLAKFAVQGKVPTSALLVRVREVFFHCGKALIRSDLWNPEKKIERKSFPSLGRILADQIAGVNADEGDRLVAEGYAKRLY
jgi:PPOX class probable FMN-dependent enzyme